MTIDIYTTGHPKSGNTWLCHLLSDILQAPYIDGGQPDWTPEYWGIGEMKGDYRIVKMHSRDALPGPTVFIYRDPRDVFTSMWHWRNGRYRIEQIIELCAKKRNYGGFVRAWWNTDRPQAQTSYEELTNNPIVALERIVLSLTGKSVSRSTISGAVFRQEFERVRAQHPELAHAMWSNKSGKWKEHFTQRDAQLAHKYFGSLMLDQGYITNDDWTRHVRQTH